MGDGRGGGGTRGGEHGSVCLQKNGVPCSFDSRVTTSPLHEDLLLQPKLRSRDIQQLTRGKGDSLDNVVAFKTKDTKTNKCLL